LPCAQNQNHQIQIQWIVLKSLVKKLFHIIVLTITTKLGVSMAHGKPPQLNLAEDKAVSVRIWRKKFNSWCLLQKQWRDPQKDATNFEEHWVEENRSLEIAAFNLALPDDILTVFDTSIYEKMTAEERKQPWMYQEKLQAHFTGQDNVMPERLAFFNCIQTSSETITDYETRIRGIARKTKFEEMKDPLQELMRDRLCTGVYNKDLRELMLRHFKEDGKTPYTLEEQLSKAQAWEAAHKTNLSIMQSS
jgi:hypothetical protein